MIRHSFDSWMNTSLSLVSNIHKQNLHLSLTDILL